MNRTLRPLLLLASLLLLPAAPAAGQTIYDLRVERRQAERVPVLIDSVLAEGGVASAELARALATRLVADLAYSGFLQLRTPMAGGLRVPRDAGEGAVAEGEQGAARLRLRLEVGDGGRPRWTARVMDPSGTAQLLGKRYTIDPQRPERAAHHLSDAIVGELTGEVGIAQTRLLFARREGTAREIWIVDYDGQNARQVTRNGSLNLTPRWSPDLAQVAYTSFHGGRQQLLLLDASSGRSRRIAEYPGLNLGASWSPSGDELLVTLSRDGNPEIYRLGLDGKPVQRLTFDSSIECSASWGPGGRQVLFTSDRTGVPQIYVMDREGSNRRRLSYEGRYNESSAWSPRGDRVAFVSRIEGRFDVFTVAPDGSDLRRLTGPGDGNNEDPSWAPDGRHIVVSSDRGGYRQLWALDVETGEARAITRGAVDDTNPDWGPVPSPAGP